jgi:hypothetical protein
MKQVLLMVLLVAAMPLAGCGKEAKQPAKPAAAPAADKNAPAGKEMPAPANNEKK